MREKKLVSSRKQALALLLLSMVLPLIVLIILLLINELNAAWSFAAGALAVFIANVYQVSSLFKENYASAAKRIVLRFYISEAIKFFLVALVFVVLMRLTNLSVLAFVIGVLLMQMGMWICLPIFLSIKKR